MNSSATRDCCAGSRYLGVCLQPCWPQVAPSLTLALDTKAYIEGLSSYPRALMEELGDKKQSHCNT